LDGKSDAPLTGQFDVVVGWGFAKDSRRPVGLKGNLLFIGGKSEGKLVAGENGEFVLQDVESLGIDNDLTFIAVKEDQQLMLAIRGGSVHEATTLRDQSGKPVTFILSANKGAFLGTVYVMP
jgi:hypothetical protein